MKSQQILINKDLFSNNDSLFATNEISFQNVVMQQLPIYLERDQKKIIQIYKCNHKFLSDFGNAMPDLIAFSEDYSYYSIIEVELSHHDWESHVSRQVKCLVNADYSNQKEKIFQNICNTNSNPKIERERFLKMLDGVDPEYMIVAEKYLHSWEARLADFKARYITMSTHINDMNEFSYLIHDCKVINKIDRYEISWINYFFKFQEIGNKYFENGANISITYKDFEYLFHVDREVDGIYLSPLGSKNITTEVEISELLEIKSIICKDKMFELT